MKIVLATDGSAHAEHAAALLSRLPHREQLDLTVVSVVSIPEPTSSTASDAWAAEFRDRQTQIAKEDFERVREMFEGADAVVSHKIREGHIGQEITEAAESLGAQLVVVGAKGHAAVDRILLGSVSDYVATHVQCSVLVVRPRQPHKSADAPLHVTLAYDDSPGAQAAIAQLEQFVWGSGVKIALLGIVPVVRTFRQDLVDSDVIWRSEQHALLAAKLQDAAQRLQPIAPGVETQVIEAEHVGEGIVTLAEDRATDLVVLGDSGRGTLNRWLLGSVSRFVLRHSSRSVWIARAPRA